MTHIRTQAVRAGQSPDPHTGAIATGIAQTTAFAFGSMARGADLFSGEQTGWTYSRSGNPTLAALEAKLAILEGGQAAASFGTGMAALSAVVLALMQPGDELAYLGPLYGGAESYFTNLCQRFGIRAVALRKGEIEAGLSPRTRLLWVETPTNPTLELHDLKHVSSIARPRGIVTVGDNTFCTPCLTRPLSFGLDLAYHSMTKYLDGHGDATGGAVIGSLALIERIRKTGLDHLGGSLAPHTAYLFLRGITSKTFRCEWRHIARMRPVLRPLLNPMSLFGGCIIRGWQATPTTRLPGGRCRAASGALSRWNWHSPGVLRRQRFLTACGCLSRPCHSATSTA